MGSVHQSHVGTKLVNTLFNRQERVTFDELRDTVDKWGLCVYPKIRVADVLRTVDNQQFERIGIQSELYRYALMAHFDFVVCDKDQRPLFTVEFDGPAHREPKQKARDQKKNALCKHFGFPLLRIKSDHISRRYRDKTVLAWIVDVYQLRLSFDEAQDNGQVPYDEPFDPFVLDVSSEPEIRYPYCISLEVQAEMKALYAEGRLAAPFSSGYIGCGKDGVMRGIEYVSVSSTHGLCKSSAMTIQNFPFPEYLPFPDLLGEILRILLYEKLQRHFAGHVLLQPIERIHAQIRTMKAHLDLALAHQYERPAR